MKSHLAISQKDQALEITPCDFTQRNHARRSILFGAGYLDTTVKMYIAARASTVHAGATNMASTAEHMRGHRRRDFRQAAREKETPSVNPSCGRWLALARCHRGGSPRTFQRAASSPCGAQATPHPGKSKRSRAAAARLAAPRRAAPRLALQQRTRTRARAHAARVRYREATLQASFEPGAKSSPLEPRTGSTTAAGGS